MTCGDEDVDASSVWKSHQQTSSISMQGMSRVWCILVQACLMGLAEAAASEAHVTAMYMSRRLEGREMLSLPRSRYASTSCLKVFSSMSRSSRATCRLSGSCSPHSTPLILGDGKQQEHCTLVA